MSDKEKAVVILEALDEFIQVDYSFEEFYLKAIMKGLKAIEQKEKAAS